METMVLENESIRKNFYPISVEAYHELGRLGKISEKTELIDGVIIHKMPKDPVHSSIVIRLFKSISSILPAQYSVRPENPITIGLSEPEPDIAIVDYDEKEYISQHPQNAHFIIEVLNTTLALDREKATIYAKANIPEYWIINLTTNEIEVYKNPSNSVYESKEIFSKEATLSPEILPGWEFSLSDYIP